MSEGKKHDQGKPRFSLIPAGTLIEVARVLEYGAEKYDTDNWKIVPSARVRYYDALNRHLQAWWGGERLDKESGLLHLAHVVCCGLFLLWFELTGATNRPATTTISKLAPGSNLMQVIEIAERRFIETINRLFPNTISDETAKAVFCEYYGDGSSAHNPTQFVNAFAAKAPRIFSHTEIATIFDEILGDLYE